MEGWVFMRINWFSNAPWAPTGYGNQTKLFAPRIRDLGHQMSITAFYGLNGGVLQWNGIPTYPGGNHMYGQDVMYANANHFSSDLIIALLDAWVLNMAGSKTAQIPLAAWYPVDSEPIPAPVERQAQQADYRIVFSRHAEQQTNMAGLDCYYVPHGVDTEAFKPTPLAEARERIFTDRVDPDVFLVGMVAANKGTPSRKALPENLQAFAQFHRKHPDSVLYLHTHKAEAGENGGVNLPEIIQYLGLRPGTDVVFVDQYAYHLGLPDEYMALMYSSLDVLLMATMGEGFGIPTVEAQACGCPVIVGDWTASGELCFSGWKIPKEQAAGWWTPLAAYQYMPMVDGIVEALEKAYQAKGKKHIRQDARTGAMEYDADSITKRYWKPVLEDIEKRISDGRKDAA